jgi:hypothetical protein
MSLKILRGTLTGSIVYFFLGWLVWGVLLMGFMEANSNTSLSRPMEEMLWWAIIIANLITGFLTTLILNWAGAKSYLDGLRIGAIVGVLLALSIDLSYYSMTTLISNVSYILVDALANGVVAGVAGALIVLLWGKAKSD